MSDCKKCKDLARENKKVLYLVECGLIDLNDGNYGLAREWFQKVPPYDSEEEALAAEEQEG